MSLIKQIYLLFDDFNDAQCYAHNGYDPEWRPTWNEDIEEQLRQIQRGSPISLPDDYCEVFRAFGGGCIEDSRENRIMPAMTFWTWDDIMEFDATVDFFKDCPNALPIGDDMGDVVYLLINSSIESGLYMSGKSVVWDKNFRYKIANSFTELFTSSEAQRIFRNYYNFGCDKGGDGR